MPAKAKETNVMMYLKEGEIPTTENKLILEEVMENSAVMKLAKYEEMDKQSKKFMYLAEGPGAYWVGEGEKIQTSKAKWVEVEMVAKKLGVIIPASREYLNYSQKDFFNAMKSKIAEAFQKKFDEAVILGHENPFAQSVNKSCTDAGSIITGAIDYANVLAVQDKLFENDVEANAFISKIQNRTALRGAVDKDTKEALYDKRTNTIDGLPVVDLKSKNFEKGTLFAGDFNHMFYGIPFNISYKISEDAQLSTIQNDDGTPVNLFEQELVALRATMDIAFMIVKDTSFAKLSVSGA